MSGRARAIGPLGSRRACTFWAPMASAAATTAAPLRRFFEVDAECDRLGHAGTAWPKRSNSTARSPRRDQDLGNRPGKGRSDNGVGRDRQYRWEFTLSACQRAAKVLNSNTHERLHRCQVPRTQPRELWPLNSNFPIWAKTSLPATLSACWSKKATRSVRSKTLSRSKPTRP